ncbi:hypothetical protein DyAD56_16030 [Dyella sp. AD56]|uniref:hypothetical protein n=1 Tax=Dyella sp. AD56 TaxID=1528744 RepID=UPI000C822D7F|nr:hypothetical protein [Dyella sp. AD56]PMQ04197.1 hypothetical protein DyAD56_16030 [Dyella sp. AD56]
MTTEPSFRARWVNEASSTTKIPSDVAPITVHGSGVEDAITKISINIGSACIGIDDATAELIAEALVYAVKKRRDAFAQRAAAQREQSA